MDAASPPNPLDLFGAAARAWFEAVFREPTRVQREGWPRIARGDDALLLAPTGSGKTLAAFLWAIDRLGRRPADAAPGVRVLYVSPLKALVYDIERNLRAPLVGIERAAERAGVPFVPPRVAVRTGDTPQRARREQARTPAEILVTTPESLYLLLGSAARETFRPLETVIVDEVHALAGTKRGAHLALSLARLAAYVGRDPQRLGLSATVRPPDEVARWLSPQRTVAVVDAAEPPRLDVQVVVPLEDMTSPGAGAPVSDAPGGPLLGRAYPRGGDGGGDAGLPAELSPEARNSVWPAIYPRLLELVRAHTSTIVFTNSRGLCERLAQRLNELAGEELVRAHHGSVSHAQRAEMEEALKAGRLKGIVATSSLELGVDMGAVDLVLLVESPGSVASGLQRIGRAGHGVGQVSRGRIFPKHRGDLLEAAVVARRMREGAIEPLRVPRNALDVLAQQVVAMCAMDRWALADLERVVRGAHPYAGLTRELLVAVLDMLDGRYPSTEFADLRPRIEWDRETDQLTARKGARALALLSGGTIPDRGLYPVTVGPDGPRIGELDEEMVHETRVGTPIVLGASTWRILDVTRDRVVVEPAPGEPGKLPFWHGEGVGRPIELGRALGAFVREVGALEGPVAEERLQREYHLDRRAARNLVAYLDEQRQVTGTLPTDRAITVERFRDELGDWRVCIHTPFGARVHAPWALAIEAALAGGVAFEVQSLWSDDGVLLRFADAGAAAELPDLDVLVPDPDEVEERVLQQLGSSALFAGSFRENAVRALLLPRRRSFGGPAAAGGGGQRLPLWAQRLKAQNLLAVARGYPSFPIVLETYRTCLQDVFDLPALVELLRAVRRREVRVEEVETAAASPFARSLVFAQVAAYLYEGDTPAAERRAQALTLDRTLLAELLGAEELRELLDPTALTEVEAELQALTDERRARDAEGLHDLLRRLGDLDAAEVAARSAGDPAPWLAELVARRRVVPLRFAGVARYVAVEDVARYRDALGAAPPPGLADAWLQPAPAPLEDLLLRWARTHAPFPTAAVAARFGLLPAQVEPALRGLLLPRAGAARLLHGAFRPGGTQPEWCDPEVLRRLKRRTLARLRREVEPVAAPGLARFLPRWQGVALPGEAARPRPSRLDEIVSQLEGLALPFSEWEERVLPARVPGFHPRQLDELGALGLVVWVGHGPLGARDGRIALYRRERVGLLLGPAEPWEPPGPLPAAVLEHLKQRGASFLAELQAAVAGVAGAAGAGLEPLREALLDLVWAGRITNDTFQPLRALRGPLPRPGRGPGRAALTAGGRWSLVEPLRGADDAAARTRRAHALALRLLERYGVVSREAAAAEGLSGGFAAVYPVLRTMEEQGKARRGHFVEGLTGAQFAAAGAVDRLRAVRAAEDGDAAAEVLVLAAVDPANPYGALLPWPAPAVPDGPAPRRAAGTTVVLVAGVPVLYAERGGRRLLTFAPPVAADVAERALVALVASLGRTLRVEQVDGQPARASHLAGALAAAGFRPDYRGLSRA
jgi:ATP-dependent Lhr-like helicase